MFMEFIALLESEKNTKNLNNKLSIVVPAYNAETSLRQCLQKLSVLDLNKEVIVVDDGSTDGTALLLEQQQSLYPWLRVIHTENQGVSTARNTGVAAATGGYIGFCDADDIINPGAYGALFNKALSLDLDIVFGLFDTDRGDDGCVSSWVPSMRRIENSTSGEAFLRRVILDCFSMAFYAGIYKETLFSVHRVNFPESLSTGEDQAFLANSLLVADKVCFFPLAIYQYNDNNPESLSSKSPDKKIVQLQGLVSELSMHNENILNLFIERRVNVWIFNNLLSLDIHAYNQVSNSLLDSLKNIPLAHYLKFLLNYSKSGGITKRNAIKKTLFLALLKTDVGLFKKYLMSRKSKRSFSVQLF
jgi:glycosyltransferase involved in cell wall biosynthesis